MSHTSVNKIPEGASSELQAAREALMADFIAGQQPTIQFMHDHARILDDFFCNSFEKSDIGPKLGINKNPYAIIALGGYGREEQCIHSDIDLLFLFHKHVPKKVENLIQEIVYPLWDLGLEVGYATRSLNECIKLAAKDYEVLTPLLDARFICGMSFLYTELAKLLRAKIIKRQNGKIIDWLVDSNRARHLRYGDSSYLLEPNLKEGQGGLRDYHTILWIARIKFNLKQPRDLEYFGCMSHSEYQTLNAALAFIWNIRNRLHDLNRRKSDQLLFDDQVKLADALKYQKVNGQQPVERLLGELHGHMEFVKHKHLMLLHEMEYTKRSRNRRRKGQSSRVGGIEVVNEMLAFATPEAVYRKPELLIKIFEESARLKIPLGAEARRLVGDFSELVDDVFRCSQEVVRSFEKILLAPAPIFNVLNEMLNSKFLLHFIPQFKQIVNRIQYDEYHLYPVDKHSLRTVQTIKKFGTADDPTSDSFCGNLYKEIKNRKLLLWAALLHDIGKGEAGGDHSQSGAEMAREILKEKGYRPKDVDAVGFLVEEHLFLIKVATRRDVNDEETAILAARRIKDPERLKMLYLLTVGDSIATGPKAWNDWTSILLRDLCLKVLNTLEKGELASQEAVESIEKKRQDVLTSSVSSSVLNDFKSLYDVMSPRYLLYMPAERILEHVRLFKQLGNRDFVWTIAKSSETNTRTVTVCAKDRPGLFSRMAGVFTLNGMDILNTQVFTWRNNIALDIFELKPPPDRIFEDERWERAESHLQAALKNELDLEAALAEKMAAYRTIKVRTSKRAHKVVVDNDTSSFFTIIEVITYDFSGLLFLVTNTLFNCRLDIWVAKIATKVDQVVDVFYVRDFDGQKVDSPAQVSAIQDAVLKMLPQIE